MHKLHKIHSAMCQALGEKLGNSNELVLMMVAVADMIAIIDKGGNVERREVFELNCLLSKALLVYSSPKENPDLLKMHWGLAEIMAGNMTIRTSTLYQMIYSLAQALWKSHEKVPLVQNYKILADALLNYVYEKTSDDLMTWLYKLNMEIISTLTESAFGVGPKLINLLMLVATELARNGDVTMNWILKLNLEISQVMKSVYESEAAGVPVMNGLFNANSLLADALTAFQDKEDIQEKLIGIQKSVIAGIPFSLDNPYGQEVVNLLASISDCMLTCFRELQQKKAAQRPVPGPLPSDMFGEREEKVEQEDDVFSIDLKNATAKHDRTSPGDTSKQISNKLGKTSQESSVNAGQGNDKTAETPVGTVESLSSSSSSSADSVGPPPLEPNGYENLLLKKAALRERSMTESAPVTTASLHGIYFSRAKTRGSPQPRGCKPGGGVPRSFPERRQVCMPAIPDEDDEDDTDTTSRRETNAPTIPQPTIPEVAYERGGTSEEGKKVKEEKKAKGEKKIKEEK